MHLGVQGALFPSSIRPQLHTARSPLLPPSPWKSRWGALGKSGFATVLGFSPGSRISLPPLFHHPPLVTNRGSLVPAPIELPCSLHTKNGNPQAILGAVPSQAVAMASLLAPGCLLDSPLSLLPSPALCGAVIGQCGGSPLQELGLGLGRTNLHCWMCNMSRKLSDRHLEMGWSDLGSVAWTPTSRGSVWGLQEPSSSLTPPPALEGLRWGCCWGFLVLMRRAGTHPSWEYLGVAGAVVEGGDVSRTPPTPPHSHPASWFCSDLQERK